MKRAVFLDRDGVLNRALVREGKPFPPIEQSEVEILPGVPEACALLKDADFLLVVVTNQPDVGRGALDREAAEAINAVICKALPIDRVEVCYEGDDSCEFRKPKPGMLRRAAKELGIDLGGSFMVGDRWRDIDAGHAAGCTTFFVDHGYRESLRQAPDFRVRNLLEAAQQIVAFAFAPAPNTFSTQ